MAEKHRAVSNMKNESATNLEQTGERIESNKKEFRRHQRELPFGEKMRIAFSLAERDKAIRRAVLLPKTKKEDK
jgi:hypothetical protein